jgi:hypothetical protein
MTLWTKEQTSRWTAARDTLADAIGELTRRVHDDPGVNRNERSAIAHECSALVDLRHSLTIGDEEAVEMILAGNADLLLPEGSRASRKLEACEAEA